MNYDKLTGNTDGKTRSLANLKPWPKGTSGNPAGRPPKSLMQQKYDEMANDPEFVEQWWEAERKRLMTGGMAGVLGTREMMERVEGKVTQTVELTVDVSLAEAIAKRRMQLPEAS